MGSRIRTESLRGELQDGSDRSRHGEVGRVEANRVRRRTQRGDRTLGIPLVPGGQGLPHLSLIHI